MKTEFQEYKLLHNFMHPNEPLKGWITEDNFTNHYLDDWDNLTSIIEKICYIGNRVSLDWNNGVCLSCRIECYDEMLDDDEILHTIERDDSTMMESVYNACIQFIEWYNNYNEN